jgi:hypothetical protein
LALVCAAELCTVTHYVHLHVQVLFDVLFNYEALLRYERQSVATGGQPYVACALNA